MTDEIKQIADGLAEIFKAEPEKIGLWLLLPNPHFGEISPAQLIISRGSVGIGKVARFVNAKFEESPKEGRWCGGCQQMWPNFKSYHDHNCCNGHMPAKHQIHDGTNALIAGLRISLRCKLSTISR